MLIAISFVLNILFVRVIFVFSAILLKLLFSLACSGLENLKMKIKTTTYTALVNKEAFPKGPFYPI